MTYTQLFAYGVGSLVGTLIVGALLGYRDFKSWKKENEIKFQAFVASRPKKVNKIITVTEARKIVQERMGS